MKKMIYQIIILLALFSINMTLGFGQTPDQAPYKTDTVRLKKVKAIIVPIAFYTPETKFGVGAGSQLFFLTKTNIYNSRLSNIFFDVIYTIEKQIILDVLPQIYFQKGDYYLDAKIKYKIYPNTFWGIGNNTLDEDLERYNMRSTMLSVAFLKRISPTLNFGFEYNSEVHTMLETEEGGILETENIPGSEGAKIRGFFVVFNQDTRDNIISALRGSLLEFRIGFSSNVLGATYSYNKYKFDIRKYIPLKEKSILALQLYTELGFGELPFQTKPWFGGSDKHRGYFKGRYIDDQMWLLQAEYRWRFHPRWSAAGFVCSGNVSEKPIDFLENTKWSFGGGIRFKIKKDLPSLVRLDLGIGEDGNSGIYFGVNEAF